MTGWVEDGLKPFCRQGRYNFCEILVMFYISYGFGSFLVAISFRGWPEQGVIQGWLCNKGL